MKRIYNRRVYDTDKAEKLASVTPRYANPGDTDYWHEALYVTKRGVYFIAASGGPTSYYGRRTGQSETSGGSGITLVTPEKAIEWCEENGLTDVLEEHFIDFLEEG